jgi:uncharacterized protein
MSRGVPDFPAPVRDHDSGPFWDGVYSGRLRLQVCSACDRGVFPPTPTRCPYCRGTLDWREVNPAVTVYSWIGVEHTIHEWESGLIPYSIVLGKLNELPDVKLPCLYPGPATDLAADQAGVITYVQDYGEGTRLVFRPE